MGTLRVIAVQKGEKPPRFSTTMPATLTFKFEISQCLKIVKISGEALFGPFFFPPSCQHTWLAGRPTSLTHGTGSLNNPFCCFNWLPTPRTVILNTKTWVVAVAYPWLLGSLDEQFVCKKVMRCRFLCVRWIMSALDQYDVAVFPPTVFRRVKIPQNAPFVSSLFIS